MGRKADAKSWKAVTFNWTDLQSYDHVEQIGVCLTQRQVAVLKALLTTAYWSTRWVGLTATADELDDFVSQIDYRLDGNDCEAQPMLFRDNPSDPCEVQFSTDGGAIWNTMFRKDNCSPGTSETVITNWYVNETNVNNNYTTYAGDIINVAPDWDYVDPDQDNALCWTIQNYVDFVCDFAITQIETNNQNRRDQNDWLDELAPAVSSIVVTMFVALIGSVVVIPAALIGGITYSLTLLLDNVLDTLINESADAYRDQDARDIIKCYMYQEITGSTPQWASWSSSLSQWESFGGNAKTIAETVNTVNNHEKTYMEWMILTEDINSIAASLPPCPCPSVWSHTWNFATHGPDTWEIDALGSPTAIGTWEVGQGFQCEHNVAVGYDRNMLNFVSFPEAVPNVTTMTITYDCLRGDFDGAPTAREIGLTGLGVRSDNSGVIADGDDQVVSYVRALGDATAAYVYLRVCDYPTPTGDWGYGLLTKITFEGEGVDPFAGRVTS